MLSKNTSNIAHDLNNFSQRKNKINGISHLKFYCVSHVMQHNIDLIMFKFSFLNELFSLIHIVDKHISYHICKYIHLDLPSLFIYHTLQKNTGFISFDSLSSIHVYNFTECILLHQQCTTTTKATTNTSFSILNTTTKYFYRYIH